jgi:Fe-S cluster biogenesis protein NfuA
VYQVLLFHGVVKEPLEVRVTRALEEVRPSLKSHGGDVELVGLKFPDTVEVRLIGSCQSCPSSGETLSEGVEKAIKALCPEITTVSRVSRGAPERGPDGTQVVHFVSPFARQQDAGWADVLQAERTDRWCDGVAIGRGPRCAALPPRRQRLVPRQRLRAHGHAAGRRAARKTAPCAARTTAVVYLLETGECLTVPEVQSRGACREGDRRARGRAAASIGQTMSTVITHVSLAPAARRAPSAAVPCARLLDDRGAAVILGATDDPLGLASPVVPSATSMFGPRGVVRRTGRLAMGLGYRTPPACSAG